RRGSGDARGVMEVEVVRWLERQIWTVCFPANRGREKNNKNRGRREAVESYGGLPE
ncbi:hypothetical protein HAX54_020114, partial [Datura stramonium]|nr:hypothetical protein [Datura stramonium]